MVQETQTTDFSPDVDNTFRFAPVDPLVSYPSYMPFDDFVDVERLRSLDRYMRQRIRRHMSEREDHQFYTGPYRLEDKKADRPGSRMIYLATSGLPDSYFDLNKTELWQTSDAAAEFALLMDFITTLPFAATGRMLIMYDPIGREVPAHRDHIETEVLHDFIWFRTNLEKPFYVLNHLTAEKRYVKSYSAWFDTVNQFHGADATDGPSFSIRVDGRFTDEFAAKIARPPFNKASTPSYWAAKYEQGNK